MDYYCHRVYNTESSRCNMTADDMKLAAAVERLRAGYKDALEKRKCVVFIKNFEDAPPCDNSRFNFVASAKKEVKSAIVKPAAKIDVAVCKATKMDGKPCTAKAKPGCEFCGRHVKK